MFHRGDSNIPRADADWLQQVAMPYYGIKRLRLIWSDSKKRHPDIWVILQDPPEIHVTAEWKRQHAAERRKRLVHELEHVMGRDHGKHAGMIYSTYPKDDAFSRAKYQEIMSGGRALARGGTRQEALVNPYSKRTGEIYDSKSRMCPECHRSVNLKEDAYCVDKFKYDTNLEFAGLFKRMQYFHHTCAWNKTFLPIMNIFAPDSMRETLAIMAHVGGSADESIRITWKESFDTAVERTEKSMAERWQCFNPDGNDRGKLKYDFDWVMNNKYQFYRSSKRRNPIGYRSGGPDSVTTDIAWKMLDYEYNNYKDFDLLEVVAEYIDMPVNNNTTWDQVLAKFKRKYGDSKAVWITESKKQAKDQYGDDIHRIRYNDTLVWKPYGSIVMDYKWMPKKTANPRLTGSPVAVKPNPQDSRELVPVRRIPAEMPKEQGLPIPEYDGPPVTERPVPLRWRTNPKYGRMKPPKKWWDHMYPQYLREKKRRPRETTQHHKDRIRAYTASIWWSYTDKERDIMNRNWR